MLFIIKLKLADENEFKRTKLNTHNVCAIFCYCCKFPNGRISKNENSIPARRNGVRLEDALFDFHSHCL